MSNITLPSRFLLLEELLASSPHLILSFPFHLFQFFSNFFRYSFLNFLSSYPYNILAVYFSGSSPLLKSFYSAISNFSCLLTSALILLSNSATNSFAFCKSFSFPTIMLYCKSLPSHQVLHHSSYFPFIQNSFYLPFFNSFYFYWFYFFFFLFSYLVPISYYPADIYYWVNSH